MGQRRKETELSTDPQSEIAQELAKLPQAVMEAYNEALVLVEPTFSAEELVLWGKEGLAIANQTVRSWESAVEYYRVGPEVARFLSFPSFMQWARCGTYLAQDSPSLAVAFFKASSDIVPNLRPQYIPRWAGLGRSLYKGTWKSSTWASKFFEVSPVVSHSGTLRFSRPWWRRYRTSPTTSRRNVWYWAAMCCRQWAVKESHSFPCPGP